MAATADTQRNAFTGRINRIEISATLAVVNEAAKLREQGIDLMDFGAGEPHFATPAHIKEAAIAAIKADFTKYTAVAGIAPLRDAIVHRHNADFGSDYKREEVIASTGGKHALFNALQVLVEHGDEVVLPVPYWVSFKDMIAYCGGRPVYVNTDESRGFALAPEMVERAITERTKLIILNSPCNPSGAVMSPEDLKAVVQMAHRRGIWVISDECYVYLNYTGRRFSVASLQEFRDRMVIVGSLSKTYAMTGWRLGYAMAPAPVIANMQKLQSQSTSNATSIVQKAAVAALTGPQDCVKEMMADYEKLRDQVLGGLRAIKGVKVGKPEGAFYAYPNVSAAFGRDGIQSGADVSKRLLHEAHVVTVPGEAFGTKEHIRISYAVSSADLQRGLERMKKWFEGLQ